MSIGKSQVEGEASVLFSLAQAFTPGLGEVTLILEPIYGLFSGAIANYDKAS